MTVVVCTTVGEDTLLAGDDVEFVHSEDVSTMNVVDHENEKVVRSYVVDHIVWYQVN